MPRTLSGYILPPQVIYKGKTDACHAKYNFSNEWDVTYTQLMGKQRHTFSIPGQNHCTVCYWFEGSEGWTWSTIERKSSELFQCATFWEI